MSATNLVTSPRTAGMGAISPLVAAIRPVPSAIDPVASGASTTSRMRPGMGTFIAVEAEAETAELRQAGIAAAFAAIRTAEGLWHPRTGSDLAAINGAAAGAPVAVHAWTWRLLALAKRLHALSRGAFDPCVRPPHGALSRLELSPADRSPSVVPHAPLTLDLGGIGKGFAVDRAIDALRAAGCHGGLVNAGGDLAVFGARAHHILCRDGRGAATGTVWLRDGAVATSDVDAPHPPEHRGHYGIRGERIESGRVTIVAPAAAVADGLTKCCLSDAPHLDALLRHFQARRLDP